MTDTKEVDLLIGNPSQCEFVPNPIVQPGMGEGDEIIEPGHVPWGYTPLGEDNVRCAWLPA
jgi:hypothetical protein